MERIIVIAEPWDFTSSDGENIIKTREICKIKEGLILEVLSKYKNMSRYLLLQKRDEMGNYNIYQVSDYLNLDIDELQLSMIGEFQNV